MACRSGASNVLLGQLSECFNRQANFLFQGLFSSSLFNVSLQRLCEMRDFDCQMCETKAVSLA
jgi:hypothetical protein